MTVYRAFEMKGTRMKGKGVFETMIRDGPLFIDHHLGSQNANRIFCPGVLYYWYAIFIELPLSRPWITLSCDS